MAKTTKQILQEIREIREAGGRSMYAPGNTVSDEQAKRLERLHGQLMRSMSLDARDLTAKRLKIDGHANALPESGKQVQTLTDASTNESR